MMRGSLTKQEKINNVYEYITANVKIGDVPFVIDLNKMADLTKTTSVQDHQSYRYATIVSHKNIVMELVNNQRGYRSRTKLPYGFKLLSDEEYNNYIPTEKNLRVITQDQLNYFMSKLGKKIIDNKPVLFTVLYILDIFLIRNSYNDWCVLSNKFYTNSLMMQEKAFEELFNFLIDVHIIYKYKSSEAVMYKILFSDEDYDIITKQIQDNTLSVKSISVIGFYPAKAKRTTQELLNRFGAINPTQTSNSSDLSAVSDELSPSSERIFNKLVDIISEEKNKEIEELKVKIQELEQYQKDTEEKLKKDFIVFNKLNSINQQNEEIIGNSIDLKMLDKIFAENKKALDKSIKRAFNICISKMTELITGYNTSSDNIDEFKTEIIVRIMDTRTSVINLITASDIKEYIKNNKNLKSEEGESVDRDTKS